MDTHVDTGFLEYFPTVLLVSLNLDAFSSSSSILSFVMNKSAYHANLSTPHFEDFVDDNVCPNP